MTTLLVLNCKGAVAISVFWIGGKEEEELIGQNAVKTAPIHCSSLTKAN